MATFNVASLLGRRGGKKQKNTESFELKKQILFVCTGNIARSASAQYLSQNLSAPDSEWIFDSAGTGAVVGAPVARYIDSELAMRSAPFHNHQAKQVTQKLVAESALVLVMEKEHLDWIVHEWPQYRTKIHLLKEMQRLQSRAGRRADPVSYMMQQDSEPLREDAIADPYGKGRQASHEAVLEIEEAVNVLIPWLGK